MRATLLASAIFSIALGTSPGLAGPRSLPIEASKDDTHAPATAHHESYRGYVFDLSENAERKDVSKIADAVRRQLDVVETAGFSPKVLQFFHSVPIIASEMACLDEGAGVACYGSAVPERDQRVARAATVWSHEKQQWTNPDRVALAADSGIGVIMLRPYMMQYEKEPVLLHEFLHAYHGKLMPNGFENRGIKAYYSMAKSKGIFAKEAYTLKDHREFFAVTASIFLAGKDSVHEPFTRAALKEKMPDYYKYLVGVFGLDPEEVSVTPVASVN
jgi:hypothetical protein